MISSLLLLKHRIAQFGSKWSMGTTAHGCLLSVAFVLAMISTQKSYGQTFNYTGGLQHYTVPSGVTYITITAAGAQGGNNVWGYPGGYGAQITGSFAVTPGQVLTIMVGGQGGTGYCGGGGGGTFVTTSSNAPLVVAGGGGGCYYYTYTCGTPGYNYGTTSTTANYGILANPCRANSPGGAGPNGGSAAVTYYGCGGGGGGLTGNGASGGYACGGKSFTNGGAGGCAAPNLYSSYGGLVAYSGAGGYGGGGGGDFYYNTGGGGGGGYGGGGGGEYYGCGGGGGSYNGGNNQQNAGGARAGNGFVTITTQSPEGCYNTTNGYGTYFGVITPGCSAATLNMAATSYTQWVASAGVQYSLSLAGTGWAGNYMTVFYDNGSAWAPLVNGVNSLTVTPSAAQLSASSWLLVGATTGSGCESAWSSNSAVLTYQITPPTTPAITQSPASGGHVCTGGNVQYTASGISVGSFDYFQYEWNGSGGYNAGWIGSNPGNWGSCCPGNVLYVEAVSQNGGCLAASSPVTVAIDNTSSAGSFVTSPIYSTADGTLYNGSGSLLTGESITGYTGSITGWGWGTNTGTCTPSANPGGYPYSAGSANMNLNCCWPGVGSGSTDVILVGVTNGACATAYNCISVTENAMVAPATASVSPSLVCAPTSGTITLSYTGGFSGNIPGGVLKWYSGSCGGTYVGAGQNLTITAPTGTTNYYCAWVDPKGNLTSCASTTYTVTAQPTVSASSYAVCNGQQITLTSSVGGTWVSNNTSVLTVSGNTATAVGPGSTTLTFTSTAAPYCTNTTPAVTVQALPVVNITGPTSFCGTTTTTLSPTSGGTWVSNNTAVATVSGYTVTGTTAGGTTNFTFTNSTAPNCASTTANVTVTGLPTVFGVTGGGTYCLGSSDPIGLSGSQTGVMYQLVYNGSTNVGSPMSGTGAALSFPNQTALGTYTVVATTVTNSCSLPMSGNAVVTTLSPNVTNNPGATGVTPTGGTLNGTD